MAHSVNSSKKWYKLAKKLYIGAESTNIIPTLNTASVSATNDFEKATLLNNTFTSKGSTSISHPTFPCLPLNTSKVLSNVTITLQDVSNILATLDTSKSTGPDGITNIVLKNCHASLSVPLFILFKKSIETGQIPQSWKVAHVTPIYKNKGTRSDPHNYRPISITSNVGKVLELIVNKKLLEFLCGNNLISASQFGFLPNHSTTDQLSYLYHKCLSLLDSKYWCCAVFLDLAAAFDSVPHAAIVQKLPSYGIRGNLFRWIVNYLSDRTQAVKINGAISEMCSVHAGVPQGSTLAPTLFVLFMNDLSQLIPGSIQANNTPGTVNDCLFYADDTTLFVGSKHLPLMVQKVNQDLSTTEQWARTWGMQFNPQKTKAMLFSRTQMPNVTINFMNCPVEFVTDHVHLGLWITNDLRFDKQVESVCRKVATQLFFLRRLSLIVTDRDLLLKLYKSYILPLFEYASPVWSALNISQTNRLEKLQRRAIRIIMQYAYAEPITERDYQILRLAPLKHRKNFALMCYGYKLLHGLLPQALLPFCPTIKSKNTSVQTRNRFLTQQTVSYPASRALSRSPFLFLTKLLNHIPELWECPSLNCFKQRLWNINKKNIFDMTF